MKTPYARVGIPLAFTLVTVLMAATSQAQSTASVKVDAAWARPTVQGQAAGGGFLRITGGPANDKLLGASASVAGRVEMHTMSMDGNVMRMRQLDNIDVLAGKTVELKPGALHLMFMDLKAPLKPGTSFPLTLQFEKAGNVQVDVKVQPAAPADGTAGKAADKPAHEHKH